MCKNGSSTASALMQAIRPTLVSLLTFLKLENTPNGQTALNAFDAATTAIQNWQHGTPAQVAVEAVNAFSAVFNVLPIPAPYKLLESVIGAGITTVLGLLEANSPAPAPTHAHDVSAEDVQAHHLVATTARTMAQVKTLVPSFEPRVFTRADRQYKDAWNHAVESGGFDASLRAA